MQIEAIPLDDKKTWRGNCSARVDAGASRIRGFHNSRECQNEAAWLVDGKRMCGRHKNLEQKRTPAGSSSP
jgi:hypothetical protein